METRERTLIPLPEVEAIVELKRAAIYDRMAKGQFPRPKRIGGRKVRWVTAEIRAWLDDSPRTGPGGSTEPRTGERAA